MEQEFQFLSATEQRSELGNVPYKNATAPGVMFFCLCAVPRALCAGGVNLPIRGAGKAKLDLKSVMSGLFETQHHMKLTLEAARGE